MTLLEQAAIYLATAVIVVPLFRKLKLGAVLGYLAAGALIGPWGLGLIGEAETTLHFAEMGVVMLLFLVGLELEPSRLWALRQPVFGLGGAQVVASGIALTAIARWLGLDWPAAAIVGFGLAMSSTAIVLAWLGERGELGNSSGRKAFAILLFQDLAVIPLIALLPLLAPDKGASVVGWALAAKGIAAIVLVIVVSRLLIRPLLKIVARFGGRDVFTAAALLVVIGASLAMDAIGLSMSLGAFLAGVLLADSEFRHELEADVEPFKGMLLGLFFIAVGMSTNLGLLLTRPLAVLGVVVGFMALKALLLYAVARATGAGSEDAHRLSGLLAQGGEFAFVLFTAAHALGILTGETAQFMILAVTVSMLLAPLSFVAHERLLERWLERRKPPEFDVIDAPGNPVIIAGYGRYGQIISRVLRMAGIPFTALEVSYQQVDFVRKFGGKVYYGDASRLELLESAKARDAKLFVLAIDDVEASVKTAGVVRKHFPDLPILARAPGADGHGSRGRAGGACGGAFPRARRASARYPVRGAPGRNATDTNRRAGGRAVAGAVRVRLQRTRRRGTQPQYLTMTDPISMNSDPTTSLPDPAPDMRAPAPASIPKAPAPWTLRGSGYILAVRLPDAFLDAQSFIPQSLAGSRKGSIAYVMFVDYEASNVGPYRELLYIPGSFRFLDARRQSITRIFVSTEDSVVNGRANWGIPKERCDFAKTRVAEGVERIELTAGDGTTIAVMEFQERGFRLPVTTAIVPRSLRTLSQHWERRQFTYTPAARGHVKRAKLVGARFDAAFFPDVAQGRVIACFKVTDFEMTFPVARVSAMR